MAVTLGRRPCYNCSPLYQILRFKTLVRGLGSANLIVILARRTTFFIHINVQSGRLSALQVSRDAQV